MTTGPLLGGDYRRYNGPFRGAKNLVLEGGIRVPAMVRWPAGIPGGRVHRGMAHFTDWLPTLLAACGVDARPELPLDGLNLLPALAGDAGDGPRTKLFWQHNRNRPVRNCNAAMRDGDWKLVWPYLPEARYKSEEDWRWYERMFTEPHFTVEIEQTMLERPVPAPQRPELSTWPMIPVRQWTCPSGIPSAAPAWSGSWSAGSTPWRKTAGASHGDRPSAARDGARSPAAGESLVVQPRAEQEPLAVRVPEDPAARLVRHAHVGGRLEAPPAGRTPGYGAVVYQQPLGAPPDRLLGAGPGTLRRWRRWGAGCGRASGCRRRRRSRRCRGRATGTAGPPG